MAIAPVVYLVDDDEAVRDAVGTFLRQAGFNVQTYESGPAFLQDVSRHDAGCILLDLSMPEMSGLEVQQELIRTQQEVPIIFLTGFGTVRDSVSALKNGAFDFLEKPCSRESLVECVRLALAQADSLRATDPGSGYTDSERHFASLTRRERQIMALIAKGMSSKQIGRLLDISPRTVDAHRGRLMMKMQVSSLAELGAVSARLMDFPEFRS